MKHKYSKEKRNDYLEYKRNHDALKEYIVKEGVTALEREYLKSEPYALKYKRKLEEMKGDNHEQI